MATPGVFKDGLHLPGAKAPGAPFTDMPETSPDEEEAFDPILFRQDKLDEAKRYRASFERSWFRNILFYVGQQWITYKNDTNRLEPLKLPEWFPTQITNRFASTCDAMASVLAQAKPTIVFGPSSDSEDDLAAADAASDVTDVCAEEGKRDEAMAQAKDWVVLNGNAYVFQRYDPSSKHGTVFVQFSMCPADGWAGLPHMAEHGCPNCGGLTVPAVDAHGKPAGQDFPRGKMMTEVDGPLTVYYAPGMAFDDSPYILRAITMSADDAKDRWPEKADQIESEGTSFELGPLYKMALAYTTNVMRGGIKGLTGGPGIGAQSSIKMVTVWELWVKPTETTSKRQPGPGGYHGYLCSQVELESGPIEYHEPGPNGEEGAPYIPAFHIEFKHIPGRSYAKTPADDLVFKQVQRNRIEAFIQLCLMRMGNPTWLIPEGSGISDISGNPGEKIRYNHMASGGVEPKRVDGQAPPAFFIRWLQQIDQDFEELAATYDVMKGAAPTNVPTLGGLHLLDQRAMGRFKDALNSWTVGWRKWTQHALWIWKEYAVDSRIHSVRGEDGRWKFQRLASADLRGNTDIRTEEETAMPKSEAFQQMTASQLLGAGLLDIQDPSTRLRILKRFHAGDLMEGLDRDVKDAIREREDFVSTGRLRYRQEVDNHEVHSRSHKDFAKTEAFFALPPMLQQAWMSHIELHERALMAEKQNELSMAMVSKAAPRMMIEQAKQGPFSGEVQQNIDAAKAGGVPVGAMPGQAPSNLTAGLQAMART